MSVGVFDSLIYRGLFADEAIAAQFEEHAQVRAMLEVEAALARAEAKFGLIPAAAAERIASTAQSLNPDPALLAEGTATDGVPIRALMKLLREAVDSESAQYVHWGATSQDILDTSLVLRLSQVLKIVDQRMAEVIRHLLELARAHENSPMLARTRTQAAVPTCFGLKAAGWAAPLMRHRQRLAELKPRLLIVQLGGAAGTQSVLGGAGDAIADEMARILELGRAPMPWHAQRDAVAELAGCLSLVTGSLGKLGQDILLLAQPEIGEIRVQGGGSSTMPQKSNPVSAELLVTLARHNAALVGELHQALIHVHERDGAGWSSEWISLPQMAVATGASLRHADALLNGMSVMTGRMTANLEAMNGLVMAEAAVYVLAAHMPRQEAERVVANAAELSRTDGGHLLDYLAQATDVSVDWQALKDPNSQIQTAKSVLRGFLASTSSKNKS